MIIWFTKDKVGDSVLSTHHSGFCLFPKHPNPNNHTEPYQSNDAAFLFNTS